MGIVTATDLGHNLILDKYELGTTVEKVMVKEVAVIGPDDDLILLEKKMNTLNPRDHKSTGEL